ncbi:MAG TPA: hypothetical protein VND64_21130 [Pirellulales bacterium]|nr:hypothetical protein [Pirellulales bacterium]
MNVGRPQFRLRSLFILTAFVAVGCLVGPPVVREVQIRLQAHQERQDVEDDRQTIIYLIEQARRIEQRGSQPADSHRSGQVVTTVSIVGPPPPGPRRPPRPADPR